jgi:YidC/Oxa1 family membrane protein insertase
VSEAFQAIVAVLGAALKAIHGATGSYVAALVLLTVGIKAVLHPLTRKQLLSMKAMQALAPQMEVLRRKYQGDPRQMNVEIMNLYRANKVNPFGGCLPLLLQLPILYALFALLRQPKVFGGEMLFGVPLEEFASWRMIPEHPLLVLIPLLVWLTTHVQQRMSITDPQQARMFVFMPIFVAYTAIAGWFPLGLSVYWIVSTAAYILEYYIVVGAPKRIGVAPPREARAARAKQGARPRNAK